MGDALFGAQGRVVQTLLSGAWTMVSHCLEQRNRATARHRHNHVTNEGGLDMFVSFRNAPENQSAREAVQQHGMRCDPTILERVGAAKSGLALCLFRRANRDGKPHAHAVRSRGFESEEKDLSPDSLPLCQYCSYWPCFGHATIHPTRLKKPTLWIK